VTAVPVLDGTGDPLPAAVVAAAAAAVAAGEVIVLPTETVYGLAVDPWRPGASERLFAVKGRPRDVVLPLLVAGPDQAVDVAAGLDPVARALMERFWPGSLTIVVAARPGLGADLGGDGTTVGLRCPDHPVTRAVCAAAGPLALTSANRHGEPPARTAAQAASLPGVALVVDGGPCGGEPSTVVDATASPPRLLRAGAVPWDAVRGVRPPLD